MCAFVCAHKRCTPPVLHKSRHIGAPGHRAQYAIYDIYVSFGVVSVLSCASNGCCVFEWDMREWMRVKVDYLNLNRLYSPARMARPLFD